MYKLMVVPALFYTGKKVRFALPPFQERVRGIYENKIRYNASPEKCYEIFASIREGTHVLMSENDFFRSLVPYNYSKKKNMKEYIESNPSQTFQIFDLDNTGTIEFAEYLFFISLLSVQTKEWKEIFQQEGEELTMEQFDQLLVKVLISNKYKKSTSTGKLPDPRAVGINEQRFKAFIADLIKKVYPSITKEKDTINFQDFLNLKQQFIDELIKYEFYSFPVDDQDCISLEDFGKSIISYIHFTKADAYLKHLESKNFQGKVTLHQFISFNRLFQEIPKILGRITQEQLETHVNSITYEQFKRLLLEISKDLQVDSNILFEISEIQIQILFELLDIDSTGTIEPEELFGVLTKRNFKAGYSENVNPVQLWELMYKKSNIYAHSIYEKFIAVKQLGEQIYKEWRDS